MQDVHQSAILDQIFTNIKVVQDFMAIHNIVYCRALTGNLTDAHTCR